MKPAKIAKRLRVEHPKRFRLDDYDPADTLGLGIDKDEGKGILARDITRLSELQELFYAQHHWALLIILQGMDAAGKDSAIKHVMSGVNPQGVDVHSFAPPSTVEVNHDYLWRAVAKLPERGRIGIFNRSYYEEVLTVRVHPEYLAAEHLPAKLVGKHLWRDRFEDMVALERHLVRNGTIVLKFHLRLSLTEQKKRFLERLDDPAKNWKFSATDLEDRARWPHYMEAYEEMVRETSIKEAPWHIVPADHKWFARLAIAATIVDTLEQLDLKYPTVDAAQRRAMQAARQALVDKD